MGDVEVVDVVGGGHRDKIAFPFPHIEAMLA